MHVGARDGVDYGSSASSERWQNLDRFLGVCGGSVARVYISAQRKNPSNMGHTHVARPSWLQQPTIRERPEPARCEACVKDSVKRLVFLCSKKISSVPRLSSANRGARVVMCHVETRRASEEEKEEEGACDTSLLTHLSSGAIDGFVA
jgi:hypothetical protein